MSTITISKIQLEHHSFKVNGFIFLPEAKVYKNNLIAIFTHGYTSSKTDVFNWSNRLAEQGIASIIFDLPGHYLGSFEEVFKTDDFVYYAHELFSQAYQSLCDFLKSALLKQNQHFIIPSICILGGHSLGALLALKAFDLKNLPKEKHFFAVGLGINQEAKTHLFETAFYQKTLDIRRQLVSPTIAPNIIFKWILEEKKNLKIHDENIVLITGDDDIVVGANGSEELKNLLKKNNNVVSLVKPTKMPHHQPELAATHIASYTKNHILLNINLNGSTKDDS